MDYKVSVSESGDYIVVKSYSPMTSEIGRQCGISAARLCNEEKIKNFMLDLRAAPNVQSVTKNINFIYEEMITFGFPGATRCALLASADDSSHDFVASALQHAGHLVKLFTEEDDARQWLTKSNAEN